MLEREVWRLIFEGCFVMKFGIKICCVWSVGEIICKRRGERGGLICLYNDVGVKDLWVVFFVSCCFLVVVMFFVFFVELFFFFWDGWVLGFCWFLIVFWYRFLIWGLMIGIWGGFLGGFWFCGEWDLN